MTAITTEQIVEAGARAAYAALEAVLALHYPEPFHDEPSKSFCVADQRTAGVWPCPTIRAIAEALGMEAAND